MNALATSLVLCFAVAAYGFPGNQVVGGKDAPIGMFPYQVSLRENGRHFCGGSIITPRYILTAAHCVHGLDNPKNISVHVGSTQLNAGGVAYEVEKIAVHRDFDPLSITNDVALIRVKKDIAFNRLVHPILLATGNKTYEGSPCVLSGWGSTHLGGSAPNNLQYVNLLVESQVKCKKAHWRVKPSHICTYTKKGEGACHGDSGGPLVANAVQIGIVSFGSPCAVGKPDVYTRVTSFESWIKNQQALLMEENPEEPIDAVYIL